MKLLYNKKKQHLCKIFAIVSDIAAAGSTFNILSQFEPRNEPITFFSLGIKVEVE